MSALSFREIRRFTIAGGEAHHRAFPGVVRLSSGAILVAYREGLDHWRTDDGVVRVVRSSDEGISWSKPESVFLQVEWSCGTHHGIKQLADGRILLPVTLLR